MTMLQDEASHMKANEGMLRRHGACAMMGDGDKAWDEPKDPFRL